MKKLLGLLATITVAGGRMTGVVADNHIQNEQKTKLEGSKINYLQTNNLENLNRIKREQSTSHSMFFLSFNSSVANKINFPSIVNDVVITPTSNNLTNKTIDANSVYIATSDGVYYVNHNSYNWTGNKVKGLNGNIRRIKFAPSGNVYFISDIGELYFLSFNSSIANKINFPSIVNDVVITPTSNNLTNKTIDANSVYIATSDGVYYVNHNSYNWTGNKVKGLNGNIRRIKFAPSGSVYFISDIGELYFLSFNSSIANKINFPSIVNDVVITPTSNNLTNKTIDANSVYIATSDGVYYVNHNSYNWTGNKVKGLNGDGDIRRIKFAPSGNVYFIVKPDLYDVITNTQLGLLNNNDNQTIINAVKTQNNLANLNYTIRNKTNNSAEFWIDNDNDHYIKWSWKKVLFTIHRRLAANNNEITRINKNLIINSVGNDYISSFNSIINELINQNVLNVIFENEGREIYEINQTNPNSSKWFRISVSVDGRNIDLVFRTSDLL